MKLSEGIQTAIKIAKYVALGIGAITSLIAKVVDVEKEGWTSTNGVLIAFIFIGFIVAIITSILEDVKEKSDEERKRNEALAEQQRLNEEQAKLYKQLQRLLNPLEQMELHIVWSIDLGQPALKNFTPRMVESTRGPRVELRNDIEVEFDLYVQLHIMSPELRVYEPGKEDLDKPGWSVAYMHTSFKEATLEVPPPESNLLQGYRVLALLQRIEEQNVLLRSCCYSVNQSSRKEHFGSQLDFYGKRLYLRASEAMIDGEYLVAKIRMAFLQTSSGLLIPLGPFERALPDEPKMREWWVTTIKDKNQA